MSAVVDITGQTFAHWTVLRCHEQRRTHGRAFWWCQCRRCGRVQSVRGDSLRTHATTRCLACSRQTRPRPETTMDDTPLTPDQFAATMRELYPEAGYDTEASHGEADRLMCNLLRALGYGDGVAIFEAADQWYA